MPPFILNNGRLISFAFVSANDMFNAFNSLGSGSRPTGFDQWMALYDTFVVHQCGLSVTPVSYLTTSGTFNLQTPFRLVIIPTVDTDFIESIMDPTELAYSRSKVYSGGLPVLDTAGNMVAAAQSGSSTVPSVYNSMYSKKIMGYKDLSDVTEVRGTSTLSPLRLWYYLVYVESLSPIAAAPGQNYQLNVEMRTYFRTQLLERTILPDSDT